MPTYVVLYKFTDAGAKNIKGTVQRARESRAENEQRGFTVHGLYWTQGQYDMVAVVEAPNEQAMLVGLFNIAGAGNVRSETLRALPRPRWHRSSRRCEHRARPVREIHHHIDMMGIMEQLGGHVRPKHQLRPGWQAERSYQKSLDGRAVSKWIWPVLKAF